jgi:O-antigen ligase
MAVLAVLLAWPLAAFGGAYFPTAFLFSAASVVVWLVAGRTSRGEDTRELDWALWLVLGALACQIVPFPHVLRRLLSPHADALVAALALTPTEPVAWDSISIDPFDTLWGGAVVAGCIALFWTTRSLIERGGLRQAVRSVCALGLAVSFLGVLQRATPGRRIYWYFEPLDPGARPFGPFVNQNHFATWVIMALPLAFGYIAARGGGRESGHAILRNMRAKLLHLIDPRAAWLTAGVTIMLLALLLSLSRSALLALTAAALTALLLARDRLGAGRRTLIASTVLAVVLAVGWADLTALGDKLASARVGVNGRVTIWRETLPIVRDFWLTGTGAGTYLTAMRVYQQSDRTVYFNQAHNHYLQIAAEGGLFLIVPVALALAAFVRLGVRRVREDASGRVWIRAGAACGLLAVALQSLWETGLTMPANAALAAFLCAVVVHHGHHHHHQY